jgi:adenylate cyclase
VAERPDPKQGDPAASASAEQLAEAIRVRYGWSILAANLCGAIAVFLVLMFVLPGPSVHHESTVKLLSVIAFVVGGAVLFPAAWAWSARAYRSATAWLIEGRTPTDAERDATLRFPLTQQRIVAAIWVISAAVFTGLSLPFSVELAGNIVETLLLGGLVTCAMGFLIGEREFRPVIERALAAGPPRRPRLPGVAARTLLTWTLGTGVMLFGLATVGLGALYEKRFTRERLSVAIVVLCLLGIVVGLLMMYRLARSLADPIEALRVAMGRVEEGDLDAHVLVDDGSEVGLLQAGFNRMVAGLREREHLRDLFGRQVGEDVVRHALERGVELGGESCEAAVLFVDLEGSTRLAQTRDPADVVSLLNEFFAVVVDVVAAHGGWVNKFEGDAALCVFGAPLPDPDAATRALAAARMLRERLARDAPEVRAGIGVSAGRVVAGNVGASRRFEYTVIGDPVNEASRLTELAKRTEERVMASDAALDRANAGESARWEIAEQVELRGRSTPTTVAVPRAPRAHESSGAPAGRSGT